MLFQSTPVIANGRIRLRGCRFETGCKRFNPRPLLLTGESGVLEVAAAGKMTFQSTPVIANGRIGRAEAGVQQQQRFNPRPLLLTGESTHWRSRHARPCVSIHARYC